jgi:photosystem II stability/assembly factor-like uncharacterized protein
MFLGAQPWMRYYDPPKSESQQEEFTALRKAYDTWLELKGEAPGEEGAEENEEQELFERWLWFAEPRLSTGVEVVSEVLWQEILNKESERRKGALLGDWHFLGPPSTPTQINSGQVIGAGRIDCIAFHPADSNTFYVGAPTGGLWKTTDGGDSWTPLTDMLGSIGITDIALYPGHPDTIFISTGDRDAHEVYSIGILRSNDGGETWEPTAFQFSQTNMLQVNRLVIRPDQPDTVLAGTSRGLYLLTDNFATQEVVMEGNFKDIELMPGNPRVIYASTYSRDSAAIYRSMDGGRSFEDISGNIAKENIVRIELAVTPAKPSMVIAVAADKNTSALYGVYRSFDMGTHWTMLISGKTKNLLGNSPTGNSDEGQGWYDLAVTISPDHYGEIYVGGINIWKSNSSGSWFLKTWGYPEYGDQGVAYIHVDQHILKVNPLTGALFAGNDGGVYKSHDGGETFTNLSDGLHIMQIYRIGTTNQKRTMAMMGSQDNSSILWRDTSWNVVIGGDGMECAIDPADTMILYAESQYGYLRRSLNGGYNFSSIKPDSADEGSWVTPFTLAPDDPAVIYAGYEEIYRSPDRGNTWEQLTDNMSNGTKYRIIRVAPSNAEYIYVAAYNNLWRSRNGGKSWANITGGSFNKYIISDITISQYDPRRIWVSVSNYTAGEKVYFSENGGDTWENYSEGLPNIPVNCLLYQDNSNSCVYAGTDLGVYVRDRAMDTWQDFSEGLPNVIVNEMQIYYPDSLLRAGSYGRGLWESKLYHPDTLSLYAEYSSDKQESCRESYFTFYNRYPGEKDSLVWYFLPDGDPQVVRGEDTVQVLFPTIGYKDVAMVIYHNGESDSLYRKQIVEVDTVIEVSIQKNFDNYYWRGNELVLTGRGADEYKWVAMAAGDTLYGENISAYPDTTVTYRLIARQGICHDTTEIKVTVWPNDQVRYATEIVYGENGPFRNNEATVEEGEPCPPAGGCNTDTSWCDEFGDGESYLAHSVWFRFTAPETGVVSIDSKGFDTQLALYDADSPEDIFNGAYTLLAANDDYHDAAGGYAAALEEVSDLTPGKTYWLQFDGSGGNRVGTFYLYLYYSPLAVPETPADGNTPKKNTFVVYPNPNDGSFMIVIPDHLAAGSLLRIFSADGRLVYQKTLPSAVKGEEIPSSFTRQEKGLYVLMITDGKKVYTSRMIVR